MWYLASGIYSFIQGFDVNNILTQMELRKGDSEYIYSIIKEAYNSEKDSFDFGGSSPYGSL